MGDGVFCWDCDRNWNHHNLRVLYRIARQNKMAALDMIVLLSLSFGLLGMIATILLTGWWMMPKKPRE